MSTARVQGGVHVRCPFESERSEAGSSTSARCHIRTFLLSSSTVAHQPLLKCARMQLEHVVVVIVEVN
jgi:hypothetical protein